MMVMDPLYTWRNAPGVNQIEPGYFSRYCDGMDGRESIPGKGNSFLFS
jgi:hypothetical protein